MKMLAVKVYRQLTGVNIAGRDFGRFTDIVGDGQDKEFNPELFVAFLYAVLVNGCHPETPDFTADDVADWLNLYDRGITEKLSLLYLQEMTGKTSQELEEAISHFKETEKNGQAPETNGATSGATTKSLPTVSSD